MKNYIEQLLSDIETSIKNYPSPVPKGGLDVWDWITHDEEDKTAPIRELEEWTGIKKEQLPPEEMLDDNEVHQLLEALINLLNEYNCSYVLQISVPERIQYANIRDNFNQTAKVKTWHYGFFEQCRPGTEHKKCSLGEYCQCAFLLNFFQTLLMKI